MLFLSYCLPQQWLQEGFQRIRQHSAVNKRVQKRDYEDRIKRELSSACQHTEKRNWVIFARERLLTYWMQISYWCPFILGLKKRFIHNQRGSVWLVSVTHLVPYGRCRNYTIWGEKNHIIVDQGFPFFLSFSLSLTHWSIPWDFKLKGKFTDFQPALYFYNVGNIRKWTICIYFFSIFMHQEYFWFLYPWSQIVWSSLVHCGGWNVPTFATAPFALIV